MKFCYISQNVTYSFVGGFFMHES